MDVRVVCNVEIEAFVQANLVAKIEEGLMDDAPIYTDLKTFPAEIFRGKIHGIIGGYPCQPFSSESEKRERPKALVARKPSGQLDLPWCFSRMSEVTPRWGYGESCPIWKKMVTERSGDCTQRRKQARLTNASDASSWRNYPTPTALEEKYRVGNTQASKNLTAMGGEPNSTAIGRHPTRWIICHQEYPGRFASDGTQKAFEQSEGASTRRPEAELVPHRELGTPAVASQTGGKILAEEAKIHGRRPPRRRAVRVGRTTGHRSSIRIGWSS